MKKIHLLVVQAFIRPFIVTFFIVMFVLLMLFLFKYIDELIGKGFEALTIAKLLWYACGSQVSMALPLAMLLSSIMTFGSLGENYELVAIKAAGISLQKAMLPLVIFVSMISVSAFVFSDYMLPKINKKMGALLFNMRSQKPSFLIKEGVFNNTFPNYSLRVKKKDDDGETIHDILIYDHNNPNGSVGTLMAKEGKMYKTDDNSYLVLRLSDGVRYEETGSDRTNNPRQVLTRTKFHETEKIFDLGIFNTQQLPEDAFNGNYMMQNLASLKRNQDSITRLLDTNRRSGYTKVTPIFSTFAGLGKPVKKNKKGLAKNYKRNILELVPNNLKSSVILGAQSEADRTITALTQIKSENDDFESAIRRFIIEYQRKFTLAVSCLILFSIGAPLGAIIRKGGLGMPVVMSIIFFLIYHIISTIAEKSAKQGDLNPVLGMWLAIIILSPLGVFLTYKATIDSSLFNIDNYKQFVVNLFKKKTRTD